MTAYAYFNQKGGVGKTTFAIHHAVFLHKTGRPAFLLDVDRQRHASKWAQASPFDITSRYCSPDKLAKELREAARERRPHPLSAHRAHETLIIDAPGELDVAKPVLLLADVVVLPCVPGADDLDSTIETLVAIERTRRRRGGRPHPVVFFNRADRRTRLWKESCDALVRLEARGIKTCWHYMPNRAGIGRARLASSVVGSARFSRAAGREMSLLLSEIDDYGRQCTHPGDTNERAA